jgi:hypothetical protein
MKRNHSIAFIIQARAGNPLEKPMHKDYPVKSHPLGGLCYD